MTYWVFLRIHSHIPRRLTAIIIIVGMGGSGAESGMVG